MLRWLFGRGRRASAEGRVPLDRDRVVVADGDTIKIDGVLIRLLGFDAPETDRAKSEHEWHMGVAAAERLTELFDAPNTLALEREEKTDMHGRVLARLYVNGRDVADIAIEEGWGVRYDGRRRQSDEMPDWQSMRYPRKKA